MSVYVSKIYKLDCDAEDYKYLQKFIKEGDVSAVDEMVEDAELFIEMENKKFKSEEAKIWDGHELVSKEPYIFCSHTGCFELRQLLENYLDDFHNQCYGEYTENVIDLLREYADKIETSLFVYTKHRKPNGE